MDELKPVFVVKVEGDPTVANKVSYDSIYAYYDVDGFRFLRVEYVNSQMNSKVVKVFRVEEI